MNTVITSFDQAIGVIAWKHPEVAFAIRAREAAARTPRGADKVREQAIKVATIIAEAGQGGVI